MAIRITARRGSRAERRRARSGGSRNSPGRAGTPPSESQPRTPSMGRNAGIGAPVKPKASGPTSRPNNRPSAPKKAAPTTTPRPKGRTTTPRPSSSPKKGGLTETQRLNYQQLVKSRGKAAADKFMKEKGYM